MKDARKNSRVSGSGSTIGRRNFIKAGAAVTAAIAAPKAGAIPVPSPVPAQQKELQPWWAARPANPKANRPVSIDMHTHSLPPPSTKTPVHLAKPAPRTRPLHVH